MDTTPTSLGPVKAAERIAGIDVARGLALLCIFFVNIIPMTAPLGAAFYPMPDSAPAPDRWLNFLTFTLFESKSYPLFSLLFGMGLAIMFCRAKDRGRRFAPVYLRRMAMLLLFGVAHAFLLWFGDILIYYAFLGTVVMWFVGARVRTLLIISGVFMVIAAALCGLMFAIGMTQTPTDAPQPDPTATLSTLIETLQNAGSGFQGPQDPVWMGAELNSIKHGPYAEAVAMRAFNWFGGTVFWFIAFGAGAQVVAMFLLGAAFVRSGVINEHATKWMPRFLVLGLVLGLPMSIAAKLLLVPGTEIHPALAFVLGFLKSLLAPLVSLLYLALAFRLAQASGAIARALASAIAATGRMALTNYLAQTLIVAAICQHWGLGYYNEFSQTQMVGLVLGIYAFQLVVSTLWLRAFAIGPLEWLWRSWTYLRPARLMKRPIAASDPA